MKQHSVKSSIIIGLLSLTVLISTMFVIKYKVQRLSRELSAINREIAKENERIHILNAEWVYITRPESLSKLNDKYLKLGPIKTEQIIVID